MPVLPWGTLGKCLGPGAPPVSPSDKKQRMKWVERRKMRIRPYTRHMSLLVGRQNKWLTTDGRTDGHTLLWSRFVATRNKRTKGERDQERRKQEQRRRRTARQIEIFVPSNYAEKKWHTCYLNSIITPKRIELESTTGCSGF